ncbi:MAG: YbhN family protein [Myxococcota bacterium]
MSSPARSSRRWGSLALRLAIALALLGYLAESGAIEWRSLLRLLDEWPRTVAALALFGACSIVTALRLPLLLRPMGFHLAPPAAVRLAFIGMFFNLCLPGGAGGDAVKIYYSIEGHRGTRAELATIVMLDRAVGLLAMLAWPLLALPAFPGLLAHSPMLHVLISLSGVATLGGGAALALVTLTPTAAWTRVSRAIARLPLGRLVERILEQVRSYRAHAGRLAGALGVSLLAHTLAVGVMLLLADIVVPGGVRPEMALLVPIGFVANTLPLTPGGLGVGEVAFGRLFEGVGLTGGVEVMLAWRVMLIAAAALGLTFYLDGRRRFVERTISP